MLTVVERTPEFCAATFSTGFNTDALKLIFFRPSLQRFQPTRTHAPVLVYHLADFMFLSPLALLDIV